MLAAPFNGVIKLNSAVLHKMHPFNHITTFAKAAPSYRRHSFIVREHPLYHITVPCFRTTILTLILTARGMAVENMGDTRIGVATKLTFEEGAFSRVRNTAPRR